MFTNQRARLIGLGSYLPEKILSNTDLENLVDTSDSWISSRTGIKERRIATDECTSDLGLKAAQIALEDAQISPGEIDLILVATLSPDYLAPSTATVIQGQLGDSITAPAFDIQASCSGFLYGLSVAKAYIESGSYKKILFIATEKMTSFIDYQDRNTCVLFGDGAAAAVVAAEGEGWEIGSIELGADGKFCTAGIVPAGGAKLPASTQTVAERSHYFKMDGKEVFKHAVRRMEQLTKSCLQKAHCKEDEQVWVIPHQANARIIDAVEKGLNENVKIFRTVQKYGNTSASSVGIALKELIQEKTFKENDKILLVAFGIGFTWGVTILSKTNG
ncbi:MAG: beta-ketoacyl-ACP synthase III [Parachlamydiaceae bacterium]